MTILSKVGVLGAAVSILVACDDGGTTSSSGSTGSTTASSSSTGAGGAPDFEACPKQHANGSVLVCDEAYGEAPFVHLPEASATEDYLAMVACDHFVDRDGATHAASPGLVGLCEDAGGADNGEGLPHAFAVYRAALAADGSVTDFQRWLVVDEKNILRPLTNVAAEGLVSVKKGDGMYDLDPTIPVRVGFAAPTAIEQKPDGATVYGIDGVVENLASGVKGANGDCVAALSDAGADDPFGGATNVRIQFYRVPSMHGAGDDEGVVEFFVEGTSIGSAMNPAWFPSVAELIATKPSPPLGEFTAVGHGTPGYIPTLRLNVVSGGGGACP